MERATFHIGSVRSHEVPEASNMAEPVLPDSAAPVSGQDHSGSPDTWSLHTEASSGEDNESRKELNTGKHQEQTEAQREEIQEQLDEEKLPRWGRDTVVTVLVSYAVSATIRAV